MRAPSGEYSRGKVQNVVARSTAKLHAERSRATRKSLGRIPRRAPPSSPPLNTVGLWDRLPAHGGPWKLARKRLGRDNAMPRQYGVRMSDAIPRTPHLRRATGHVNQRHVPQLSHELGRAGSCCRQNREMQEVRHTNDNPLSSRR